MAGKNIREIRSTGSTWLTLNYYSFRFFPKSEMGCLNSILKPSTSIPTSQPKSQALLSKQHQHPSAELQITSNKLSNDISTSMNRSHNGSVINNINYSDRDSVESTPTGQALQQTYNTINWSELSLITKDTRRVIIGYGSFGTVIRGNTYTYI